MGICLASAFAQQSVAVTNQLPTDAAQKQQLRKDWENRLMYLEKETLDIWPPAEPYEDIVANEPATANWKVRKKDGTEEYLEKAPDPNAGYTKVWCRFKSPVQVSVHYVGMGTVDQTPRAQWGEMYWHAKTRDWGASHPFALACQHDQDYAVGVLDEMERAIDPEGGRRAQSLWYELLNMRGGPHKDEADFQAKLQAKSEELHQLVLQFGQVTGIGDLLWRIHEITIGVEPKISPAVSIEDRVMRSRERRPLLRQAVAEILK